MLLYMSINASIVLSHASHPTPMVGSSTDFIHCQNKQKRSLKGPKDLTMQHQEWEWGDRRHIVDLFYSS